MGFDLDPLDDVLPEPAAINARAGGKFQPKAKARPRKGTSASVPSTISNATKEKTIRPTTTGSDTTQSLRPIDVIQNGLNDTVGSSLDTSEIGGSKDTLKDHEGLVGGVSFTDNNRSLASVSSLSQVFASGEDVGTTGAPPSETGAPHPGAISDGNGDWHSSFGKKLKNYEGSPSELQFPRESRSSFLVNPSSQLLVEDLGSTDALHSEVAASDGNGDWVSSFGKSVGEADTLGFDLDPFDDILPGPATSNVRGSGKFQPKAKSQPRKETSASVTTTLPDVTKEKPVTLASIGIDAAQSVQPANVVGNRLTDSVGPSSTTSGMLGAKEPLIEHVGSFSGVTFCDDDRSSVMVNPSGPLDAIDALHSEVAISDGNGDWNSSYGKSTGENADIFSGLEYLDDFLSQPATVTVSAASKPQPQVNMNALPGNKFLESYPVYTDAEGRLSPSEAQNLPASNNKDIGEEPGISILSSVDLAAAVYDPTPDQTYPILSVTEDQAGGRQADVCKNDQDFQIDNRRLQPEEVEAFSGLETLDILSKATLASGQHMGENPSQSKLHTDKDKPSFDVPHPDTVESVSCSQDAHLLPSETEYMDEDSIPAFPAGEVLDFSSVRFSDSASTDPTYELPVNNKDLAKSANLDAAASGDVHSAGAGPKIPGSESSKGRKRKTSTGSVLSQKGQKSSTAVDKNETGKSSRRLRKRILTHELVDESEDEARDNGAKPAEPPINSVADEDRNRDDECKVKNLSRKKRAPRKSMKSVAENEKPVRKRKNANETGDKSTKEPPKKFSHSTRRKRRCVDKTLLETPEDEIDPQKLPIRDLIVLSEMRERMNKEASSSKVPLANQSADDSYLHDSFDNGWETGATEQARASNDDEENVRIQSSSHYINYQSYMDKTPTSRWSKSDTELFYEAVQQFGTDFSMIMQLFPGRTRNQVKLKYKMEERKHPLRLFEASTNRAKDHSHFELVIEQLKQVAAQEEQNSKQENSVGLTGVEEEMEEVTLETNEGATKSGQNEEGAVEEALAEDKETDVAEFGPEKSDESDDDLYRWSQYKSEL
uniref:Myb-like domain-containing protein n=1 Tax=Vitis vinifera TaxID=29760 RepID=F6I0M5_VITVI